MAAVLIQRTPSRPRIIHLNQKGRPAAFADVSGHKEHKMTLNLSQFAKRQIDVGIQIADNIAAVCWDVLVDPDEPTIFRMGNRPVRVFEEDFYELGSTEPQSRTRLETLSVDSLSHEISKRANFIQSNRRVPERYIPVEVVKHMLADPNPRLPRLRALTHAPCFTSSGQLICKAGYDDASGVLYLPGSASLEGDFTIGSVTRGQIDSAVSLFQDELLADFPFVGQQDRANAFSLILLPFVREMINGYTPLHLINKLRPGEGATLLATAALYPAMGFSAPRTPPPNDESEWRRTVFALLSGGPRVALFDNVRKLTSPYLASVVTSSFVTDRRVGTGAAHQVPANPMWIATSINAELSDELRRRILPISLDSGQRNPAQRKGFRIPYLQEWVQKNRRRLIEAALIIVKGWVDAGCPESANTLGGFEKYAAVMGGILEHAGVSGFLDSPPASIGVGSIGSASAQDSFCRRMDEHFCGTAVPAKDLLDIARQEKLIRDAQGAQCLGIRLGQMVGQNFSGIRLEKGKIDHGTIFWKVVRS